MTVTGDRPEAHLVLLEVGEELRRLQGARLGAAAPLPALLRLRATARLLLRLRLR